MSVNNEVDKVHSVLTTREKLRFQFRTMPGKDGILLRGETQSFCGSFVPFVTDASSGPWKAAIHFVQRTRREKFSVLPVEILISSAIDQQDSISTSCFFSPRNSDFQRPSIPAVIKQHLSPNSSNSSRVLLAPRPSTTHLPIIQGQRGLWIYSSTPSFMPCAFASYFHFVYVCKLVALFCVIVYIKMKHGSHLGWEKYPEIYVGWGLVFLCFVIFWTVLKSLLNWKCWS